MTRPGEAEAVEAALECADGNDWRALTRKTTTGVVAAAYPVIAAAVREQVAQEIDAARRKDRYVWDNQYKTGFHDGTEDGLTFAARIARGSS